MSELSEGARLNEPLDGPLRLPPDSPGAVWTPSLWRLFDDGSDQEGPPLVLEPRKRRALGQQRVKVGHRWEKSLPDMGLPEPIAAHLGSSDRMSVNTFLALAHSSPVSERIVCVCNSQDLRILQERLTKHADSLAWLLLRAQDVGGNDLWVLLLDEEQRRSLVAKHGGTVWSVSSYGDDVLLPHWIEHGDPGEGIAGPWIVDGERVGKVKPLLGEASTQMPPYEWNPGRLDECIKLDLDVLAETYEGKQLHHPWVGLLGKLGPEGPLFLCASSAGGFKYAPGVSIPAGTNISRREDMTTRPEGTTKRRKRDRKKRDTWKNGDWLQVVRVGYSEGFEEFAAPGVARLMSFARRATRAPGKPTAPDPPRGLSVWAGDGCAVVRFTPGFDGGSPIERYEYSLDMGSEWRALDDGGVPGDRMIPNLSNEQRYVVRLRAVNSLGPGLESSGVSVIPSAGRAVPAMLRVDRALRLATGTEIGELIELRRATKVQTVSPRPNSIVSALTGNDVDQPIGRSWRSFVSGFLVLCVFVAFAASLARHEESGYVGFLLIWAGTIASGVLFAVLLVRLLLGPRLWSALIEVLLPTKKVMAAVQPASPTFAERNCIVLDEDALSLIGVKSGEEVRLHSVVKVVNGSKYVCHRIKSVKAHAPTDSELERRRRLVGGGRHAPIPSAEASLGMASQLPWAWVDADIRDSLGLDGNVRLQAVIVEPSRRYAFIDSLAEFAIVSALAAVGAITVLFPGGADPQSDAYTPDGGAVATFGILIAIPFFFLLWRLRRRLK